VAGLGVAVRARVCTKRAKTNSKFFMTLAYVSRPLISRFKSVIGKLLVSMQS
jgi:hypothetical protein